MGEAARPRVVADNATPAGNGLMAELFARLYHLTANPAHAASARALLASFAGLGDGLASAPTLLRHLHS